jgi:hypothetical protein
VVVWTFGVKVQQDFLGGDGVAIEERIKDASQNFFISFGIGARQGSERRRGSEWCHLVRFEEYRVRIFGLPSKSVLMRWVMRLGANWRVESVETSIRGARFEKSFVLVMDMGVEDLERRDIVFLEVDRLTLKMCGTSRGRNTG